MKTKIGDKCLNLYAKTDVVRFKWWIVSARVAFVSLIVTTAQNTADVQTIERGVS